MPPTMSSKKLKVTLKAYRYLGRPAPASPEKADRSTTDKDQVLLRKHALQGGAKLMRRMTMSLMHRAPEEEVRVRR